MMGSGMQDVTDHGQTTTSAKSGRAFGLLEMTVLAIAVAGILYFSYFQLAPWIWSQDVPVDPAEVLVWVRPWILDRDGIELYALYVLMLLDLLLVFVLSYGWNKLAGGSVRYLLALPLVAVALAFANSVGFEPPMNTLAGHTMPDIFARSFTAMAVIFPIVALLHYLQKRSAYWEVAMAALLLIPVCFISTEPIAWKDYEYILAPAFRLFQGAGVSEVYFQYDLLLSLIALAWMKLRLDLNLFQVVDQCAFYLLLLGIFALSRRWFVDKRLPVVLLVALVLVRMYSGMDDVVASFQLTPLRLDLWLVLLALVYFKGPYHWSAGLFCGLMLLLHHNFGIIYSAAYIQLLLTLSMIDAVKIPGRITKTVSSAVITFFKRNRLGLFLMLAGVLAHYLIFRSSSVPSDLDFVSLGIGFMKIATNSFYWYVVVVSGLSFVLLFRLCSQVSSRYLATGFCLIYLAIGNSLYFFGRSHENSIINISAVLLTLFFLMLDLAGRALSDASHKPEKSFLHRNLAIMVSLACIALITIWYGDKIANRVATQARNALKGQFIYPGQEVKQYSLSVASEVRSVTGGDPKVYFVELHDFLMAYYGGYALVGYYNPVMAWVSRRDFDQFLQGLLDQGYYLVVDNTIVIDMLSHIKYSNRRIIGSRTVAWKERY